MLVRYLRAIDHPFVNVITHPANRTPGGHPGYDLDCADIGFTVTVIGYDEYRLDGDGDGYGCE